MILKQCCKGPESMMGVHECSTPAALHRSSNAHETPLSGRGSSMFSPGEDFWNEAIQVVDGLFAQTGNALGKVPEDVDVGNVQMEGNSHKLCEGRSSIDKLHAPIADGDSCFRETEVNVCPSDKPIKTVDGEASPLPVKHLDFSHEGRNFDESVPREPSSDNRDYRGSSQYAKYSSVNDERALTRNLIPAAVGVQSNGVVRKALETGNTSAAEMIRSNSVSQESDGSVSASPSRENMNVVASSVSDGTSSPSSSMPLKNRLDLSNWLPSTVCDIYRRKGIVKLYPWQVSFFMPGALKMEDDIDKIGVITYTRVNFLLIKMWSSKVR